MSAELSKVLDHIEKISEIERLDETPPTSHVIAVENALRADEPRPSLAREDALANAADTEDDHFRVPPTGTVS